MTRTTLSGVIFDLDGTLVDSALDFDQIRKEMGLPHGAPILETLATLPEAEVQRCQEILARHEYEGAQRATLMPGVVEFLELLESRQIPRAVVTRNARHLAIDTLKRLQLRFDPVLAREDGPVKPDPALLLQVCQRWSVAPDEVVMIGDFRYDLEAGRAAGSRTVLFTAGRDPASIAWAHLADAFLHSFHDAAELLLD